MFCFTDKVQPERTPLLTRARAPEPEPPRGRHLSARWQRALAAARKRVSSHGKKKKPKAPDRAAAVPASPRLLERRLRAAVDAGWPRRFHGRYRAVKVFLTYWADDDNNDDDDDDAATAAAAAARALADVLGRAYGFDVETWLIPGVVEPQDVLSAKLRDVVRAHGREGDLLIFWYGGRVMETEEDGGRGGPLMWFGERFGAKINSDIVPMILGASDGDVLALYDCEASPRAETAHGAGVLETLAAGRTHGYVPGFASRYSFTRSLVRVLEEPLHMACGIAVLDLHRKLGNQARRGRTPNEADRSAGGPSPDYCHLSRCGARSEGKPATIVLSRMDYPLEAFGYDSSGEEREVTVRLRLRKNDIDVGRWTEWITSAPPEADQVHASIS